MTFLNIDSIDKTINLIKLDEGFRQDLYKCTQGFNTIGYGFNLDSNGIPVEVANYWLSFILQKIRTKLYNELPCFNLMNDARKYVLINMAYNLGFDGLLKFHDMIKALDKLNYFQASKEMRNSKWYREVPNRAERLISIMINGEFPKC